jgi:hypothetical protein
MADRSFNINTRLKVSDPATQAIIKGKLQTLVNEILTLLPDDEFSIAVSVDVRDIQAVQS